MADGRFVIRGWLRVQWATAGVAALATIAVPWLDLPWRLLVVAIATIAIFAIQGVARRRVERDLSRLEQAVSDLIEGPAERVVLPVAWPELTPLAEAIESGYSRVRLQMRLLEQQREDLAIHLTRTEERLRDPTAEARRVRIARIGELHVTLTVGEQTEPAALLDLSLESAVLGVKPDHAEKLVPGLPVRLSLSVDGNALDIANAVVLAPARGGLLDLKEWVFRFEPPLRPDVVPADLAQALELRRAERIRPLGSNPATATLIGEVGRLPAEVVDVSSSGLGVRATMDAKGAGKLGTAFTIQLHLPAMGEVAILPVTLRNMAVRTDGVRMGLSFDKDADVAELGKVRAWFEATRKALAAA